MADLHGTDPDASLAEEYESPDEYADQGDTRVVRHLRFLYNVGVSDAAGNTVLEPREALQGDEVTVDQVGVLALSKGERDHAFYTSEERERIEAGQEPEGPAAAAGGDVSSMGEYELAEYIKEQNLTVNQTIQLAGTDKDLAERLLRAESIATDGEPRKGVETGLTSIIEG